MFGRSFSVCASVDRGLSSLTLPFIILFSNHNITSFSIVNSRAKSTSLRSSFSSSNSRCMGRNAGWSPRMGTYRTGICSSAACDKYLLGDCGRQKFFWIMNLLRFDWWITTIGKSIPNQYEPVRDLPFSWKKVSLRIDSLPTEREMLASIPSLHSRLNCWIATQLFTILPVSHAPPYLSRPIHRSMLGWNASIPIPSFMISGYDIFPVQKHIHAEYSST